MLGGGFDDGHEFGENFCAAKTSETA